MSRLTRPLTADFATSQSQCGTCCKRCSDFERTQFSEPFSALRENLCFSQLVRTFFASAHGPPQDSIQRHRGTSLTAPGHVLEPNETLFTNGTLLLVVSFNGCFHSPNSIRQLLQAERLGIGAIPIIVEDCFWFPQTHSFRNSVLSRLACRLGRGESLTTSSQLSSNSDAGVECQVSDREFWCVYGQIVSSRRFRSARVCTESRSCCGERGR